ncbi:MAG: hypothetical protein FD130_2299, partial [Halothiobacillaceae bacterium]
MQVSAVLTVTHTEPGGLFGGDFVATTYPAFYDRVKESSTSTGISDFSLSGSPSSYQSFAVVGDCNVTWYCIAHQSANEFEVGVATYSAGTLARDIEVLTSSNNNDLVSFSSCTKDVFLPLPAAAIPARV